MARGVRLSESIGRMLSSSSRTSAYLQKGSKNALKIGQMAEDIVPRTGSMTSYATNLENKAIALRQAQVGRRFITGAGLGTVGTIAMSDRKKSGIGSYRPAMPQTRGPVGSGRFA